MFDIKFITDYNSSPLENLFDYTFYNKKIGVLKSSYNKKEHLKAKNEDVKKAKKTVKSTKNTKKIRKK